MALAMLFAEPNLAWDHRHPEGWRGPSGVEAE